MSAWLPYSSQVACRSWLVHKLCQLLPRRGQFAHPPKANAPALLLQVNRLKGLRNDWGTGFETDLDIQDRWSCRSHYLCCCTPALPHASDDCAGIQAPMDLLMVASQCPLQVIQHPVCSAGQRPSQSSPASTMRSFQTKACHH